MSACDIPAGADAPRPTSLADIFATPRPADPRRDFGFIPAGGDTYLLPAGVIMLEAVAEQHHGALIDMLKTMGVPSEIGIWKGERRQVFYRLEDPALLPMLASGVPQGVTLIGEGDRTDLADLDLTQHSVSSVVDLSVLTAKDIGGLLLPQADPVVTTNPLLPFSLRGQSEKFKRLAIEATPLLGEVGLKGQVTIWYAGPGTGKTLLALSLIVDAVREGRIAAGNVYYINADDNGSGFATKLQIMDDIGAHTLSPGFRNLQTRELTSLLHKMADGDDARGVLVVVDTIKKFASLMDKKESSAIAQAFRQVAMKGGTVLGLAHTTKNGNADGTPRYAGTSDLVDDADAVYLIKTLHTSTEDKERVVEFQRVKSRGDSAETAAYAFSGERGVPYDEMLASVRPVDPSLIDEFKRIEKQHSDAEIIAEVEKCLGERINTKMLLAKTVASRTGISGRAASRLIERYTGDNPAMHRWRFVRGERGAQIFELLPAPPPA